MPRETAIRINKRLRRGDGELTGRALLGAARIAAKELNYWEQRQVSALTS